MCNFKDMLLYKYRFSTIRVKEKWIINEVRNTQQLQEEATEKIKIVEVIRGVFQIGCENLQRCHIE